jgi:hypothetical protein
MAGARVEQFAVGGCAYYIYTRKDPDATDDMTAENFSIFERIVRKCWNVEYLLIEDLKGDVVSSLKEACGGNLERYEGNNLMKVEEFESRIRECKEYMLCCKPKVETSVRC